MYAADANTREKAPGVEAGWRRHLIMTFGRASRHWISAIIAKYSAVGDPAFLANDAFPWIAALEGHWRDIRAEADAVLTRKEVVPPLVNISPDHKNIADQKWKSFFLWGYGYRIADNCARCLATAALLQHVPGLESAFFSIMEPGGRLVPHRGVTKAIFTAHLGLRVPRESEKCWMKVDGQKVHWQEGKMFAFDDTYEHEVINATGEERVILLLHVRRPVRFPGSLVAAVFLAAVRASPFIQDALKNLEDWNSRAR
jgi:aspartyl/asparaginyl beta-hydroxylase (cupin superfamily)